MPRVAGANDANPNYLASLHNEDIDNTGKVEVRANIHSHGRQHAMLENLVGRMSLEPETSAVSWQVVTNEEQQSVIQKHQSSSRKEADNEQRNQARSDDAAPLEFLRPGACPHVTLGCVCMGTS